MRHGHGGPGEASREIRQMAHSSIPHFHNDPGVRVIHVGAKAFMCIGARPPFDHPHIFIDLGTGEDAICSYCGTLYRYNPDLAAASAEPAECIWQDGGQEAA